MCRSHEGLKRCGGGDSNFYEALHYLMACGVSENVVICDLFNTSCVSLSENLFTK